MAEAKTKPTDENVLLFIERVTDPKKLADAMALLAIMQEITGEPPVMWGASIIGFGCYHYKYASGHEGDAPLTGFSPRKDNFSVYIMAGFDRYDELMAKLGKHKVGKACLYIKKLADIDLEVLKLLINASFDHMLKQYPPTPEQ